MNLEVGKTYKTRSGNKVEILMLAPDASLRGDRVIGKHLDRCTKLITINTWASDGGFLENYNRHGFDIAREWKEPPLRVEFIGRLSRITHHYQSPFDIDLCFMKVTSPQDFVLCKNYKVTLEEIVD